LAGLLVMLGFGSTPAMMGGCARRALKSPDVISYQTPVRGDFPVMYGVRSASFDPDKQVPSPLIIVDGQKFDGAPGSLKSEDIESFSHLKEPSEIAPYGEQGKNGVIIVTTKQKKK
jgi:TonB-dependent SusC/RagA subfamily outer membrane receptor